MTGGSGGDGDLAALLEGIGRHPRGEVRELLSGAGAIHAHRAPGRLDVMGGIADYSGSLALQLPLDADALCAVQERSDASFRLFSSSPTAERFTSFEENELSTLADAESARRFFADRPDERWCAYVLGILPVWRAALGFTPKHGLDVVVRSSVPEGAGVSSSAALEVSTATAIARAYGLERAPLQLALDCQRVENTVAGAPCGAMDQITAACGRKGRLLELLCQPAEIRGHHPLPTGMRVWGIDSGVRHSVAGSAYATVRTAAFMGHRILADAAGFEAERDGERVRIPGDRWRGYLANVTLAELEGPLAGVLPERMDGGEFLERYGGTIDRVTRVDPESSYPVRAAAEHPIHEMARIRTFARSLTGPAPDPRELGDLMLASHASYGACGLGSAETDRIVERCREAGPAVFGAKITGGGSGGTVAVLAAADAGDTIDAVASGLRVYSC